MLTRDLHGGDRTWANPTCNVRICSSLSELFELSKLSELLELLQLSESGSSERFRGSIGCRASRERLETSDQNSKSDMKVFDIADYDS